MRPFGSPKTLEKRRRFAIRLFKLGLSLHQIARRVGSHPSSVMRWRNAWRRGGEAALKPKPVPGRPSKLSEREKKRLLRLLLAGAIANGYRTDLWTTARIAEVIKRHFDVQYHRDHIGRLMAGLRWTYQKPEKRALERNDAAIEEWKRVEWPRVKKTPSGWVPTSSSRTNRGSS